MEREIIEQPEEPKGTKLIITNPPWSINKKFFARAVQLGVP